MKILGFLFQEGTSVMFAALILLFALVQAPFLQLPHSDIGLFAVTMVSLGYLSIQMSMAAFAQVGQDRPLVDLFFSFFPLFAIVIVVVVAAVSPLSLSLFDIMGLVIITAVVMMDVIFNTQVLFKINRLATDFVQMR